MIWHILTGEYPPQGGGVSDYTQVVARELAAAGDEVHVWAPPCDGSVSEPGISVHRLESHFGISALRALGAGLGTFPRPRRLLVQYVPHAFGWKAMNLAFCIWLATRRRDEVWVLFHEVAFPLGAKPITLKVLGIVTHAMAGLVARAASRIFISIPAWERMLRPFVGGRRLEWLPIPSNIPVDPDLDARARVRARLARPGQTVLGHFGTYGEIISRQLDEIVPRVLDRNPSAVMVLLGRGGEKLARALMRRRPELAARIVATGPLTPEALSQYIASCDLMLQPYPDGISSRRTSAMAALSHGVAVVSTRGALTESIWSESGGVALAAVDDVDQIAELASRLLDEAPERVTLSRAGCRLYEEHFAAAHVVEVLRA